jgi:hypothetical protein
MADGCPLKKIKDRCQGQPVRPIHCAKMNGQGLLPNFYHIKYSPLILNERKKKVKDNSKE